MNCFDATRSFRGVRRRLAGLAVSPSGDLISTQLQVEGQGPGLLPVVIMGGTVDAASVQRRAMAR